MGKRAVVIEDTVIVARALSTILNLEGFDQVTVVTDSRQAVATIRSLDPDLVVLDIRMAHLSGVEVIETLGPRTKGRPGVLVYTATPQEEVDRQLRKSGLAYDVFLSKPAGLPEMKLAVREALATVAPP
jgi:CheY-like chemotaxis protein